ncbi:Snf7-like protein [Elsinoe australis]|uniref:Snf7-like protein n=1 Tax=Elsinoe australis TaxID=40998 RepID=A0A4U7B3K7_9PEZI|nr:Snf7-like protein [Elsinoe australis]
MSNNTINLLAFLQSHEPAFRSPARLSSLYSSFHNQRTLNPDGYTANTTAWLSALTLLSRHGLLPSTSTPPSSLLLSSSPALPLALSSPQNGQPLSLPAVLHDAVQSGALIPLDDFLGRENSIYENKWRVPSPLQVVKWGLAQMGIGGGVPDRLVKGEFVVRSSVEVVAGEVVRELGGVGASVTERVMPRGEFEGRFREVLRQKKGGAELSKQDMRVVLRFLSRDRPVLSFSEKAVKVAVQGQGVEEVTREDESIANIRGLITDLGRQVEQLTERVGELETEARKAVKEKQNIKAKRALRAKKASEGMLEERSKMLETLEKTWRSIEVASDNVAIVEAMKEGRDVLAGLNQKVGGAEGVEDVIDGLREQMDVVEDVTGVINEGSAHRIDEGEVEDELEALEKEERDKVEARERAGRGVIEARERAERERREKEEQEALQKRLEGIDVPMSEPSKPEEHEDEDKFEEANEMAQ